MRARGRRLSIGVALAVLALPACGQASQVPNEIDDDVPGQIDVLDTKISALRDDPCHTEPAQREPRACEKFVTQLGNTAGTMREIARGDHERLAGHAERLESRVTDYRDGRCGTAQPVEEDVCVDALVDLADTLDEVRSELDESTR
ncbi:hypothetical protein H0B56_20880 [Haloechinothrix sp. YIM 98757]|uniref:Secreted protein n=1 Tax=Haloechinothrix aidingensis TaxID=2752311 RepID=A0A838AFU4_9PSEU|nr:hypothetical protein [Haloechinothrix aidingensis]MBA0128007.1 hypothetical protein [Haloechinothrix aidingensis]